MKYKTTTNCQHLSTHLSIRNYFISYLMLFSIFLTAQNSNVNSCTTECHQRTVKKDILHGPTATDCTSCHESNGKEHPLEDVEGFALFAEGAALCYSCHVEHQAEHDLKYVHKPVKNGECTECHEVHSSNDQKLVFAQAPDLCFFCHSKLDDGRKKAKTVHTPSYEGDACLQCHTPHASAQKRLLADVSRQLCLNCHNKIIKKEDGNLLANIEKHLTESTFEHRALRKRCTSCHDPHFSERELLLKENFPMGSYAKGIEENFTLCFECHDTDLLNVEKTTVGTEFRQGDRNLHFVHINKDKGRNCTTCHDIHAANNTKLIATTVKFGRWDMPLNYLPNDNGGTCATGCHKERSYSREEVTETSDD
jgi:predicted CXXCH cytochrome family protein